MDGSDAAEDVGMTETVQTTNKPQGPHIPFKESIGFIDDAGWVWQLLQKSFETLNYKAHRLPSQTLIRHSWNRLKMAPCFVIHWEARGRSGGAIVEEIVDVDPNFDVAKRVIILTSNPIHEDVVYFSELGIKRIVRVRNREKELAASLAELQGHISEITQTESKSNVDDLWRRSLMAIDRLPENPESSVLEKIEQNIAKIRSPQKPSARDLDAIGSVAFKRSQYAEAFTLWNQALSINPNYFRTYQNMIKAYRKKNEHYEAYQLMQKLQLLNRSNISRLVGMGELQLELQDDRKAEHFFRSALEKDAWSSGALNGMATLKFRQGELDLARGMLEKSRLSYRFAAELNRQGIEMVRSGRYTEALEHYSKAQYVLPQQEKGPQLFYNIGLCYSRWGRFDMASEFLKLALIKEPNYKKAQKLLEQLQMQIALRESSDMDSIEKALQAS